MIPLSGYTIPMDGLIPFVICDSTGLILRTGYVPDTSTGDLQALTGEYVFAGIADQATQYIDDPTGTPTATDRPASGITMDFLAIFGPVPGTGASVFLHDVPNGASVEVTDPAGNVFTNTADGTTPINIRLDRLGTHQVLVSNWPNLDFVGTFSAPKF